MRIEVSHYDDIPLNSFERYDAKTEQWVPKYTDEVRRLYTRRASISVPGQRGYIGRVDHPKITSMKKLVDAYIRQVVKREGVLGTYVLEVEMCEGLYGPGRRQGDDQHYSSITG